MSGGDTPNWPVVIAEAWSEINRNIMYQKFTHVLYTLTFLV